MNTDAELMEMLAQHQALLERLARTDAEEGGEVVFPELHEDEG